MGTLLALQVVILGIVEGLTEFIPVSSTAHLLIAGRLINVSNAEFLSTISIAIQVGAILAAVVYFWHTIWTNKSLIGKIIVAFIPTAILGIVLYPLIKHLFENNLVIALALIAGGIGLILIKPTEESAELKSISYRDAFLIGLSQVASFIPGISRSGATLIGGSLLRISRVLIVPFSFLLAIPTILGATVVEVRSVQIQKGEWSLIILGMIISFFVAMFTIRFFITLLTKKPLSWFGWYRITLGAIVLVFLV